MVKLPTGAIYGIVWLESILCVVRFVGTKTHGYLDYIMGVLLIAAPWIFDFAAGGAETWVPVILGAGTILYSMLTDYELVAPHRISMRMHLTLDMISGALLAVSPWLFGFADYVWQPHFVLGILEIGAALCTKRIPGTERRYIIITAQLQRIK